MNKPNDTFTGLVRPVRGATANIGSIVGLDDNEKSE